MATEEQEAEELDKGEKRKERAEDLDRSRQYRQRKAKRISSLWGLLFLACMVTLTTGVKTEMEMLRIDKRYPLDGFDCSNPEVIQDFSSIPDRECSKRKSKVRQLPQTDYLLLQEEKRRYVNGFSCELLRTKIVYQCGMYDHSTDDWMSSSVQEPQEVSPSQCKSWIRAGMSNSVWLWGRIQTFCSQVGRVS